MAEGTRNGVYVEGAVVEAPRVFGDHDEHVSALVFIGGEVNPKLVAWGRDSKTSEAGRKLLALKEGQSIRARVALRVREGFVQYALLDVEAA